MSAKECKPQHQDAAKAKAVAENCLEVLDEAGLAVEDCIACGTEGCVYSLVDGNVAKVSSLAQEANLAAYLLSLGNPQPSLPQYYGVWQLPVKCAGSTLAYIMVREDLVDITEVLEDPRNFGEYTWELSSIGASALKANKTLLLWYAKQIAAVRKLVPKADRWAFSQMVELFGWLTDHGIDLPDVDASNLGYRAQDHRIVVRDLGYSRVSGRSGKTRKIQLL